MSDLRDFTGKNRRFTGTVGERISTGATGDRVNTTGVLRFNSTTNLMEYYTGTDWKSIDAPPTITAFTVAGGSDVTSAVLDPTTGGDVTIEVKGSLFDTTGAVVTFVGTGETLSTSTITRNSANLLTVTLPYSGFDSTNEPYTIKVTNGSGLSAELQSAISADQAVVFTNAADTNYDIFDSLRGSGTIAAADLCGATDADGDTITYSVSSGSLPTGFTLDTADGSIDWSSVSAVGSDVVTTFTIQAATTDLTITRQFTITVKAPQSTSFTSTGAFSFSVPSGVTSVDVLVVAGGGGAGAQCGAGGGAGGLIYRPAMPVTPGGTVPGSVGAGGSPSVNQSGTYPGGQHASNGSNTTFSTLTAIGGGRGGYWDSGYGTGSPGGSGGGNNNSPQGPRSSGTQPSQPGDSGTYGFGNPGGSGPSGHFGGGGGGAGGAGQDAGSDGGDGGVGRAYSISGSPVFYAGGGGGGSHNPAPRANPPGGNGGGGFGTTACQSPLGTGRAQDGTANRGGGGGGAGCPGGEYSQGGGGGSGIVIVSF
jgi:hypothetical protein